MKKAVIERKQSSDVIAPTIRHNAITQTGDTVVIAATSYLYWLLQRDRKQNPTFWKFYESTKISLHSRHDCFSRSSNADRYPTLDGRIVSVWIKRLSWFLTPRPNKLHRWLWITLTVVEVQGEMAVLKASGFGQQGLPRKLFAGTETGGTILTRNSEFILAAVLNQQFPLPGETQGQLLKQCQLPTGLQSFDQNLKRLEHLGKIHSQKEPTHAFPTHDGFQEASHDTNPSL